MMLISYVLVGLCAGIFGGFLGLGGGLILIPALIYIYGLTQHQAQGTALAIMVPPITLLAAIRYYYNGDVKLGMAFFIALGFILGGLIGAHIVQYLSDTFIRKIFGLVLLIVALRMTFFK